MIRKDIFKKQFEILSTHKNFGLFELLEFLQETAIDHAEQMGIGFKDMVRTQAFWVLTRQSLQMHSWPRSGILEVVTWSRPLHGISATRDFEIYYQGEKIGECTTRWLVLDANTHRPIKPILDIEKAHMRSDYALSFEAGKVESVADAEAIKHIRVQQSDLDANNHVNNTKYTQWILQGEIESPGLLKYEINFISETHLNEHVMIQSKDLGTKILFQGLRENDQKILFTAAFQYSSDSNSI